MIVGKRILARLAVVGISQAELARRVGMSQGAMNHLIAGRSRSSTHLHKIARELGTTPVYLSGEIEDPDEAAPPPPPDPTHHLVMLPVALPTEAALIRMFEGLLRPFEIDREALLARTLARQLPKGLRQLQGPLIEYQERDRDGEGVEALPDDRPAPRRATRT